MDVHEDIILISTESFQKAPSLKVSKLINDTEWIPVTKTKNICQGSVLKEVEYKSSNPDKEFCEFKISNC